jgi:S1-C subfamily serine protease
MEELTLKLLRMASPLALLALALTSVSTPLSAQSATTTATPVASPSAPLTGHLSLNIVIISDLQPAPVLLSDFIITGMQVSQTVRTDVSGNADVDLIPGHYHLASVKPTVFKGQSFVWGKDFDITAGVTTKLSLTDEDATVSAVAIPVSHIADEAVVYNQVKSGVVTVEGDFGQGSGFLIDKSGLIITNQHVINGGRWAAVRFNNGTRVSAVIIAQDSSADVAVLRVNPSACSSCAILNLADPSAGSLAVEGERVLAIGSPLGQENVLTIGIVSKVDTDYLVSDVNINHGSSGGPLLDLDSKVIGITTFIDPGGNGPGISGIISIGKALPVLARAKQIVASISVPSDEELPTISATPIPESALNAATTKDTKPWVDDGPKNFQTVLITPFYDAAKQNEFDSGMSAQKKRRVDKRDQNGIKDESAVEPGHFWEHYALHDNDAFVAVVIRPVLKEKASSVWVRVTEAALFGATSPAKMEYRDDFWDMALYRDDTLVHPVRRQRDNVGALYFDENVSVADTAIGGIYMYDPSAFAPGATLRIYSRRESDISRWDVRIIPSDVQQRIWNMFAGFRNALDASQQNVIIGLSPTVHTPPQAGAESTNSEMMARYLGDVVTPGTDASISDSGATANVPTTVAITYTITMDDGTVITGTIDHQDSRFIYLTVPTGIQLVKKADIKVSNPALPGN